MISNEKACSSSKDRLGWTPRRIVGGVLVAVLALGGCDFTVTNPGPVPDDILDEPNSHAAVVGGLKRAVSNAWNQVALETSAATREIMASGNLNISVAQGRGLFEPDESNGMWSSVNNARWVGDDAVRRLTEVDAAPETIAEAHLWAGFAYRMAGENFCRAVFDGGAAEPHTAYFDGAVEHFTAALNATTDPTIESAARAGRATVYMSLGEWDAASSDAAEVPEDFVFQALFSAEEPNQWNDITFYTANQPYRVHSVWNTPYEQYYLDTGDPRTPWGEDPNYPFGEVQRPGIGNVPWMFELKYTDYGDDVNLVSSREMQLIQAEALLVDGDWEQAMEIINDLRTSIISETTGDPLEPWPADNLDDAWTRFRRERGIELWLEARRLNDLRRWEADDRPGALHPLEDASNPDTYLDPGRDLCVPIAENELETNPNIDA